MPSEKKKFKHQYALEKQAHILCNKWNHNENDTIDSSSYTMDNINKLKIECQNVLFSL